MTAARLGDLCDIRSGGTPRREESGFYGGPIAWAKIGDLERADGLVASTEESLTDEGLAAIRGRLFPPGTVLLAMYGSVGKVAVAGTAMATNQAILGIQVRKPELLSPEFLRRWLQQIQSKLIFDARGVTQQNISATLVRDLRIPLPPLAEQRQIAAVLDKADVIRRKRRKSLELLDEFSRSAFLEMFGDPVRNEKRWKLVPLEDLVAPERPITYGILKPGHDVPGGVPYVRVVDMAGGTVTIHTVRRTSRAIADAYRRSTLRDGDLLLSIRGHVGRIALVPPDLEGANITQDTARLAVVPQIVVEYLAACLASGPMQRLMSRFVRGVAVTGINLGDVKKLPIPVPPFATQERFKTLARRQSDLQVRASQHGDAAEELFGSLAQRAFTLP